MCVFYLQTLVPLEVRPKGIEPSGSQWHGARASGGGDLKVPLTLHREFYLSENHLLIRLKSSYYGI